jgi:cell division protein FtsX
MADAAAADALPLDDTAIGRWFPALAGGLVCLAVLALAIAMLAESTRASLDARSHTLVIALPPQPGADAAASPEVIDRIVGVLLQTDGVLGAEAVPAEKIEALLGELTGDEPVADMALPQLIDVLVAADGGPGVETIERVVHTIAEDAVVDAPPPPHRSVAATARILSVAGIGLAIGALAVAVGLAIGMLRADLGRMAPALEVLAVLGSPDGPVVGRVRKAALRTSLVGALAGFAVAALLVLILGLGIGAVVPTPDVARTLGIVQWLVLACVPVIVVVATVVAADRLTLRRLHRIA